MPQDIWPSASASISWFFSCLPLVPALSPILAAESIFHQEQLGAEQLSHSLPKHSSWFVHIYLCRPLVAQYLREDVQREPWGSITLCISSIHSSLPGSMKRFTHKYWPSRDNSARSHKDCFPRFLPPKPEAKAAIWIRKALPSANSHVLPVQMDLGCAGEVVFLQVWIGCYKQMSTRNEVCDNLFLLSLCQISVLTAVSGRIKKGGSCALPCHGFLPAHSCF